MIFLENKFSGLTVSDGKPFFRGKKGLDPKKPGFSFHRIKAAKAQGQGF